MKFIGVLLVVVGFTSMEHGGGFTWGQIAMIIIGTLMVFPQLVGYLFEDVKGERK